MGDENLINNTKSLDSYGRYEYENSELITHRVTEGIIGLVMIFSAFTNLIVIGVLLSKRFGKRTSIKYLYANISLSDEVFIFACVAEVSLYGHSSCELSCRRFLGLTVTITGFVSAYTMALIAFKRYYSIAFPLKEFAQKRKTLKLLIAIVVIWSCSTGGTLYFVRYIEIPIYNQTLLLQQCTMLSYSFVALRDDPYFPLVAMVIVPLALGFIFSLMTIFILLRRKLVIGDHVDIARLTQIRQTKLKATCMILVVILSFIISWLPITLLALEYTKNYSKYKLCDFNYNAYAVGTILLMLSFFINPVIYWYMCPHFRRGMQYILAKMRIVKQPQHAIRLSNSSST